ncbi:MerR family DNA-binding transcriptional regulator [Bacillus licheniformis]|uniref:MerR family DNA-binding transcriptional regulator n=1 Tax=Bacillus licheniformis TaxID=1402 RepID=UPI0040452A5E
MNNRFRVGEVARLFKLPASTLRYYDEIGLFRPKYTDPETLIDIMVLNNFRSWIRLFF